MTVKGNTTRNKNIQKKLDAMLPDPFDAKTNFRLEEEVKRMTEDDDVSTIPADKNTVVNNAVVQTAKERRDAEPDAE